MEVEVYLHVQNVCSFADFLKLKSACQKYLGKKSCLVSIRVAYKLKTAETQNITECLTSAQNASNPSTIMLKSVSNAGSTKLCMTKFKVMSKSCVWSTNTVCTCMKHTSKENMQIAAAGQATKPNERTVILKKMHIISWFLRNYNFFSLKK